MTSAVTRRKYVIRLKISYLSDLIFILYLGYPALVIAFEALLRPFGLMSFAQTAALITVYLPCFILVMYRKISVPEFWAILVMVILFLGLTLAVHPEYEPWYTRAEYGVWDYVLRPDNGIYIYPIIRIINDPKRILRCIKVSSVPMYIYAIRLLRKAIERGYWVDTSNKGYEIHLSYNLSLGYTILLFMLTFLYCALEERKLIDIIGTAVGLAIILMAGSRGPILDIAIFLAIYILIKLNNSRKKWFLLGSVVIIGAVIWNTYIYVLNMLTILLNRFGVSSRFIQKMLAGEIADDSGRYEIWKAAIEMIRKKPLGYGAMGSRHVISQYIYVAHPHQIFLEILIDFGVITGSCIIILMIYHTIRLFTMKYVDDWKGVFLIFFARACQLLISLTFWHSIGVWGTLAVGVCMAREYRQRRGLYIYGSK